MPKRKICSCREFSQGLDPRACSFDVSRVLFFPVVQYTIRVGLSWCWGLNEEEIVSDHAIIPKITNPLDRFISCPYYMPSFHMIKSVISQNKFNRKLAPSPISNKRSVLYSRVQDVYDVSSLKHCWKHTLKYPGHSMNKEIFIMKTFSNKYDRYWAISVNFQRCWTIERKGRRMMVQWTNKWLLFVNC